MAAVKAAAVVGAMAAAAVTAAAAKAVVVAAWHLLMDTAVAMAVARGSESSGEHVQAGQGRSGGIAHPHGEPPCHSRPRCLCVGAPATPPLPLCI